jgi:hypothetical protein
VLVELHSWDQLVATETLHLPAGVDNLLQSVEQLVVLQADFDACIPELRVLRMMQEFNVQPALRVLDHLLSILDVAD